MVNQEPDFFKMLMKNEKIEYLEEVYDSKKMDLVLC